MSGGSELRSDESVQDFRMTKFSELLTLSGLRAYRQEMGHACGSVLKEVSAIAKLGVHHNVLEEQNACPT